MSIKPQTTSLLLQNSYSTFGMISCNKKVFLPHHSWTWWRRFVKQNGMDPVDLVISGHSSPDSSWLRKPPIRNRIQFSWILSLWREYCSRCPSQEPNDLMKSDNSLKWPDQYALRRVESAEPGIESFLCARLSMWNVTQWDNPCIWRRCGPDFGMSQKVKLCWAF